MKILDVVFVAVLMVVHVWLDVLLAVTVAGL